MVRVAIIGCGKIADQHVSAIRRIPGSSVVAVCDRELLMARQLAERWGIPEAFPDAQELLERVRPDAVHLTTPPQSHHRLTTLCLEAGSHVYVEKPFTVDASECESLVRRAAQLGLCITAGHNYQFTREMLEMRRLVEQGYLGGKPFQLESYWSYDLNDTDYVKPLIGNAEHWVRKLPGRLLHNIISHGIARLAEFLSNDIVEVVARGWQSAELERMGCPEVMDELRVLIRDRSGTSASFCFSTQVRPSMNRLDLRGPANSLSVDLASGSLIRSSGRSYKSYLTFLIPPLGNAKAHFVSAGRNAVDLMRWRLHHDAGMKELIQRFHRSIADASAPPIPYAEIVRTARIMDQIFAQIDAPAPVEEAYAAV
jgi:predicted dehydrogenase